MATTETWVLDGVTVTGGGAFDILELNVDPPKARPNWLTAADSESGALMRQPLHENRTITMKLRVAQQASMNAALDQVGVIVDKFRSASSSPDGVALVWTPANSTRSVTFDVLAGEILEMPTGLDGHSWSWFKQRPIFTLEMACKPYWRGTEVVGSTTSGTTPVVTATITGVTGDVPALGRLIVTDLATQSRREVEWGIENTFYDAATSLVLDSDSLVTSGFSGVGATRTGAYDPNATGNNVIRTTLYRTTGGCCGTGALTHVGVFNVRARVWISAAGVQIRFGWQVGAGPFSYNAFTTTPYAGSWFEVDLGTIIIPEVLKGTQTWQGRVEAYSTTSGDTIDVDYIELIPALDGYGRARAGVTPAGVSVSGYDEFTTLTAAAALNARVAPAGGTWATSGATTDFVGQAATTEGGMSVTRQTASDSGYRFAQLGTTNFTNVQTDVFVYAAAWTGGPNVTAGPFARYVDASNFIFAALATPGSLYISYKLAGVVTTVSTLYPANPNTFYMVRLTVYASGYARAEVRRPIVSTSPLIALSTYIPAAATGGALATGKAGFLDQNTSATATLRIYDWFTVGTPELESIVMNSTRSTEFRHDSAILADTTNTFWGPVPGYRGSRFLVPPGTSRVAVKARRQQTDGANDDFPTDSTQLQIAYTPRGLVVPR